MDNTALTSISNLNLFKETDEFSFVLKPSATAGVGVFLTHNVHKGTRLMVFGGEPTRKYKLSSLKKIGTKYKTIKEFIDFFGVADGKYVYLPANFSCMNVGCFMNHSVTPNAHHDKLYRYFASRDIMAGEEIFINYAEL